MSSLKQIQTPMPSTTSPVTFSSSPCKEMCVVSGWQLKTSTCVTHSQTKPKLASSVPACQILPFSHSTTASCEGFGQKDVVGQGSALQTRTRHGYQNRGGTYVRVGRRWRHWRVHSLLEVGARKLKGEDLRKIRDMFFLGLCSVP